MISAKKKSSVFFIKKKEEKMHADAEKTTRTRNVKNPTRVRGILRANNLF